METLEGKLLYAVMRIKQPSALQQKFKMAENTLMGGGIPLRIFKIN